MAYSASGKLPFETASKLGHLHVIESEWVKALIDDFESNENHDTHDVDSLWKQCSDTAAVPLKQIWVVDGSYVPIKENKKELVFVKTALMTIDQFKIAKIDKNFPHPLLLQDIMRDSAMFHATVFPLKNISSSKGNLYDTVRNAIFDSMRIDENGMYFETLKWLVFEKWNPRHPSSPDFECPRCGNRDSIRIAYDKDKDICPHCSKEVLLTDMIGFHLDMTDDSAPEIIASMYMAIMELLMLFTVLRLHWENSDKTIVSNTLYIKDGPLMLKGQYSKLVPCIRAFLDHAKNSQRPIHIMGCEKSGFFFDYLNSISKCVKTEEHNISYFIPSHEFIRKEIQRSPDHGNPYGLRTNWGEKVFVVLDQNTHMVLNMSPGQYDSNDQFPSESDIMGLYRILVTLPSITSRKYEGALYPVELVNGIASMSNYPSAKILENYVRDTLAK